jgi:group II intron reverse transcriptase/maturase
MLDAQTSTSMSLKLLKVAERAKRAPEARFNSLAHLIDVPALGRAYRRMRKDAAVGVDGMTKEAYGEKLDERLSDLHARLMSKRYRHQAIRRVHIPKAPGKTRPIGISVFEDKLVQDVVREVLEAIYEPDFLPCSYGFRPGRGAHDAIRSLDRVVHKGEVSWILEADVMSFFDSLDRTKLKEMLQIRVADGSLLRLIGKCLHVGILDGAQYETPERGAAQGSVLSPLLGNIYLHYALDVWFETVVKPRLAGKATLVRYCDDFVIAFELEHDARRVLAVLPERLGKYGLTLHPDKTRLVPFRRPSKVQSSGKGEATFDYLGFTLYWGRARTGRWGMWFKTRGASLRRALQSIYDWCRSHRHLPVKVQRQALETRMRGHYNYFGVSGNFRSLLHFAQAVRRIWHKWLLRRSQRHRLDWERYDALLKTRWALPKPRIAVRIWGASP